MSTATATKTEKAKVRGEKRRSINQMAGTAKTMLKRRGVEFLKDHKGNEVPIDYVPAIDLVKHVKCLELVEKAKQLKDQLAEFKFECQDIGDTIYDQLMHENEVRDSSVGGFTLGTFDKSSKVLYKMDTVSEKIPEELRIAEEYWEKYLEKYKTTETDISLMIEIVNDVLHNSKDEIDVRQIGKLNRYGSRVKDKNYHKFLEHLNQAYDTRHTKRYEQFYEKDNQGEEQSIVLTYTKLKPQAPEEG